ncbi:MAG TPA: GLUG motif-containing protein, partial [Hyphomicrobium zavarzinii]|nr:GLUG motif-containing protein [Hyphomicrobium zavarzinii]
MSARRFRRISYIALLAVLGVHLAPVTGEAQQHALPQGPSVVSGGVTVGAPSGGGLTVTQSTPRAIVNWNSFSVGQPNSVTFQQPGSSSAILNRVTGGTTSTIAGKVSANGQVFLVNPNGIAITPTGTINVGGGFVGSTLDIRDQDFLGGVLDFFGTGSSAGVVNQGSIQAGSGGFVGLLGGNISNAGTISVPLGRVGLGAGERAALDLTGDGFLQVAIPPGTVSARALIDSSGRIKAPGGRVELKAATVRRAIRDAVNVSGTIAAKSVSGVDGAIVLGGGEGGNVNVTGTLDAGGATKGGAVDVSGRSVRIDGDARISTRSEAAKGGAVTITASDKITLGKAKIDASGATGGGHVRIGGDLQGGGTLTRAHDVVIGADAEIRADAAADGNGGTIIVWSDSLTSFEGRISARGGALGGDGGFVEVSGKQVLDYRGLADLTSYKGRFGTLLLDPYDITIWSGASARVSGLTPSANDSLINVSTLRDQIELANVTLTTGASGSQNGNITLLAPLSWTADTVLTLSAAGSIFVHAPIVATGTSAGFAVNHGGQFKVSPGAFVSLPGASSTFSANGESYTMIRSVADLQAIQNGLAGKYAIAVAIDAADTATWNGGAGFKPIGKDYPFFTGSLQGLGNPIVNLTINRPGEDRVGLFSVTDGGAFISNVALAGVSITGQSKVGGLVGTSYGASTISSSYVTGSISANGWESSVGGIVGYAWNGGVIADSFSSADVTGTGVVGGLVGFNQGTITRSHATGTITATNYIAGGLVGSNYGTVQFSYATGVVHAASMMAGGLVGDNTDGRIDYSYSTGSVTGGDSVGGLVGYMNRAAVLGSYATGSVAGQSSVGGLVGASANSSHVTQSYWDIQTTGISWGYSYASGTFSATGLTTAQATSQASYTSFDFTNTWVSFDGARPMLRHEYSQGIWNTNQLQLMGLKLGGRYVLTQDIDARATGVASSVWGTSGFSPVGTSSQNFTGSFDGAGFEISGLTINRASQTDVGLFGRVRGSSSRISNVGLVGGSIRGGTNTGSLVGQLEVNATVSNSYASSTVAGTTATGGLIGIISAATVEGSHATGAVTGQASSGGLVGSVTGTIRDSYATGTVTGDGSMGGLAGGASSATISGSYATGNVTSTGNSVGGLLGGGTQTTVLSSYASGTVQGAESVGGLIGSLAYGSTLSKSYATGAVSGTTQVGGLVGYLRETNHSPLTSVTESYATGNVTATGSKVGGLVGYSNYYTTVAKSYATGNVSGLTNVGGLIGESWQYTKISYSYATGTVSGTTSVGGLVGVLQQASTTLNSYATGAVTGSSRVGGLVGSLSGSTVMQSYATGDASGPESIGGLVGYLYQGSVYSSYARGNATGTGGSSNLIGGLVGVSHGSYLESNYSTGTALGTTNVGGFIGLNNGSSLSANYWDTQSSGRATGGSGVSYGVTGRTTAQMQDISNFATNFVGWDFSGIWVPPNQAGQGGDTTAHYPELYAMARAIAVKADDASVTYGDARPSFTYGRYGGYDAVTGVTAYVLAGPETITPSDIPGAFSLADPNASSKSSTGHDNAGSYAITANAVASPGISAASPAGTETYRLIVVPGTLTVDRKALTATATANNKVYDATAAGSVTFADDRLSGDVLTVDSTETVFADVNVGTGIATTTSGITLSGADAANYSVNATATSSADITVRHVTVTADAGQSKVYGTTDPVLAYAISSGSLVGSDTFSGVLSRAAGENVG